MPVPGELTATVAVKVTDWPYTDGVNEVTSVVAVEALLTVWPPMPVEVAKLPSLL